MLKREECHWLSNWAQLATPTIFPDSGMQEICDFRTEQMHKIIEVTSPSDASYHVGCPLMKSWVCLVAILENLFSICSTWK